VTFRVMHGYGSATAINAIAEESQVGVKPLTAYYVGDWDPSGLHMSELDLPARIGRYGGAVHIERIALLEEDVSGDLPSFDAATKTGDPRHRWFVDNYGERCWELDAMSPVLLRQRTKAFIFCALDRDAWAHAVAIEAVEVASMKAFSKSWQASKCAGFQP